MPNGFNNRKLTVINIKDLIQGALSDTINIFDYSTLAIKFESLANPLDIGAWCYQNRLRVNHSQRLVRLDSILDHRKVRIENFLDKIILELTSGKKESSLIQELKNFERFIDWCDNSGHSHFFCNEKKANTTVIAFIEYQKGLLRVHSRSILTAVTAQNNAIKWLASSLGVDQSMLIEGLVLLKKNMSSVNSTVSPLNKDVMHQLKCYEQILNQISDILINQKPLPYLLELTNQSVWLMPQKKVFATAAMLKSRQNWPNKYYAYDYLNGCISQPEEIEHLYDEARKKYSAQTAVKSAITLKHQVNTTPRHYIRIFLFNYAQAAFYNLFLANTGMNSKQAFEMTWSEEFITKNTCQGFKTIKQRAKGKTQNFEITSTFLPTFKLYLKLRSFILDGNDYPKLFVCHFNGKVTTKGMNRDYLTNLTRKQLAHLIGCKPIPPRAWRAYKSVKALEQTRGDIKTTSDLLQNTPTTLIKSYGNVSIGIATKEFQKFYKRLVNRAEVMTTPTPSGNCTDLHNPETTHSSIKPDCKSFELCLFCEHYAYHADREDIHKLLSMKYVILETKQLASSKEHFDKLFSEVLFRIDELVNEAISRQLISNDDLGGIKKMISSEELSPYWQQKLDLLSLIGAI